MKKLFLFALITQLLNPSITFASGPGTSGGQFLRVGVGARAAGMGGAFSSLADDASAIYWNPSGLAQLSQKEVTLSYNAYFLDTSAQFLGYAQPMAGGVFGVSVNMLSVKDIGKRSVTGGDADAPDQGTFKTSDLAGTLAYARKLDDLNLGVGVKYISSDLGSSDYGTASANAFAVDLGAMYNINENLQASLAVLNLGTKLKYISESDPLPLNIKPGVAWKGDVGFGKLNAVLDADLLVNDGLNYVQPGVEYWPIEMLAIRAGYQIGRDSSAGGLGAGLGFRHSSLSVDYAFVPFGNLGDTHRVSLGLRF